MLIYEAVRAYINDNGLKQEAVAKNAGMSELAFSEILNGKRKMYAEDLRAICFALNTPADVFIEQKMA